MFKNNFIKLCTDKGVPPTVVCVELGLSKSAYTHWTETTKPRDTTLLKVARYFNVSVDQLLSDDEEANELAAKRQELINIINSETDMDRLEMIDKLIEATQDKKRNTKDLEEN